MAPLTRRRVFVAARLLAMAAVLVLATGLVASLWRNGEGKDEQSAAPSDGDTFSLIGKPAPNFTLTTTNGNSVTLSDLKGKVVLVDFWATWCPPCRASLPHIQHLSEDTGLAAKGFEVLAVNNQEEKGTVQDFMNENHYTFTVPMDIEGNVARKCLVTGFPTTMIVGRDAKVKKVWIGFDPSSTAKEIDDAIDDALKEAPGRADVGPKA